MLQDLRLRCRALFRRDAVDRELDEELQAHFDRLVDSRLRRGLTLAEAKREARHQFGNADQIKEAHRDARGTAGLESLLRDLQYAIRQGRSAPATTCLAMVCLGLGIGVNTAMFGVVQAVMFQSLPVAEPERVLRVSRGDGQTFSYPTYLALQEQSQAFSGLAATVPMESDLEVDGDSDIAVAEVASANYAEVIGVRLLLGRWFPSDREPAAVISQAVWEGKFHRRPDVVGQTIRSESQIYTIVGVAPPEFGGVFAPMRTDIWVPMQTRPSLAARLAEDRVFNMLQVFGRLRPGATADQASAELNAIDSRLATDRSASPSTTSPIVARVVRGRLSGLWRTTASSLITLLGAVVGLILLIACANVGHLLLARGVLRRREFVMRRALGASRARLLQQLLAEAAVLAIGGAVIGLVLAVWTNWILQATFPTSMAVFALHVDWSLDWRALMFTAAVAAVAAALCGVWPAWRASSVAASVPMSGEVPGGRFRRQPWGVMAQVVMSLVLLFVAGSFLQGLAELQRTDPGFTVAGRVYAHTVLPSAAVEQRRQLYAEALERLRGLPGVESAALTSILPLIPAGENCVVADGKRVAATASDIGPGYLKTLGIGLVAGREFTEGAPVGGETPVIVNESLARATWPDRTAVGQPLSIGCDAAEPAVVVGVARDSVIRRVGETPGPHLYLPVLRQPGGGFMTIVVATSADAASAVPAVRAILLKLGQALRVYEVEPLAVPVIHSQAAERWLTSVLSTFGVLALILSAAGLYGAIAYRVSRRTREIGVRMALGASRADVFRGVMGQGLAIVAVGIVLGEVLTAGLTGVAASTLEGVSRAGPWLHVAVCAIWIGVAVAACLLPSARAARVDPLVALRHE